MRPAQTATLLQMLAALAVLLGAERLLPMLDEAFPDRMQDGLALAAGYATLCSVMLAAPVAVRAAARFLTAAEMDGAPPAPGSAGEIDARVLRNTAEQFLLLFPALLGLGALQPLYWQVLLPLLAGSFILGRALFWLGYRIAPVWRGFGFALTFYPTLAVQVYLLAAWLAGSDAAL